MTFIPAVVYVSLAFYIGLHVLLVRCFFLIFAHGLDWDIRILCLLWQKTGVCSIWDLRGSHCQE